MGQRALTDSYSYTQTRTDKTHRFTVGVIRSAATLLNTNKAYVRMISRFSTKQIYRTDLNSAVRSCTPLHAASIGLRHMPSGRSDRQHCVSSTHARLDYGTAQTTYDTFYAQHGAAARPDVHAVEATARGVPHLGP